MTAVDAEARYTWWRGQPREDASAIVGLQSRPVLIAAVVVWAGFLALGVSSGDLDRPGLYTAAFVALGTAWAVALRAPGSPIGRASAASVVVLEAAAAVGVIVAVEPVMRGGLLPCAGASAIVGALLCLRGQAVAAWISFVVLAAAIGVTGTVRADSLEYVEIMVPGNLGVLLVMTAFAAVVGPRAEQIYALRRQSRRESASTAVRAVRDQQLARLDERVRPLLQQIAAGEPLDDQGLEQSRLAEAQLRDRIRAPGLDVPELADAAWAARRRGVRVLFLDDHSARAESAQSGLPNHTLTSPALVDDERADLLTAVQTAAVAALGDAAPNTDVTVRLLPAGRAVAATISVVVDGSVELQEFTLASAAQ
ncbi:hypothetical protein L5G32_00435 [Gordonia sp. HY002]|uniref:hypothetical protein n=1 Tax=Gordonia zhenghanii TaxID=2911516 RepID=UPI001EEFF9BC|nr:hypothetical protein [Gordonia zhenghanii]MCF8568733.1 hypothetical protein [Gordonia zhenghanii]MCF8607050.1 hypothetical protein [Gordonia zhenghanii]